MDNYIDLTHLYRNLSINTLRFTYIKSSRNQGMKKTTNEQLVNQIWRLMLRYEIYGLNNGDIT